MKKFLATILAAGALLMAGVQAAVAAQFVEGENYEVLNQLWQNPQ